MQRFLHISKEAQQTDRIATTLTVHSPFMHNGDSVVCLSGHVIWNLAVRRFGGVEPPQAVDWFPAAVAEKSYSGSCNARWRLPS